MSWSAYAIVKAAVRMSAWSAPVEILKTDIVRARRRRWSPHGRFYQALADDRRVSDPSDMGRQIASILLDTTDAELSEHEVWHVGHSA